MIKIGMLTPSSNTILEPVTYKILQKIPTISVHFSRFIVREISLSNQANNQFQYEPMIEAAKLLADADVDLIVWNGTSASWLGLERDKLLCRMIEEETGIPMITSSIAIIEAMKVLKVKQIGLVTPYTEDVSNQICRQYASLGYNCVEEQMAKLSVNKEFAYISEDAIRTMLEQCAKNEGVEALAVVCTNLNAAHLVKEIEENYEIPVIDSISATVWYSLKQLNKDTSAMAEEWGRLFNC